MKLENISEKIKKRIKFSKYASYQKQPLNERVFLLEAGQGLHINGNVFAFIEVLEKSDRYDGYSWYVSVTEKVKKSAEKKLKKNGFSKTRLVIRDSESYRKLLATAKFLITDNSFPSYFVKRDGQVYLNTWHGTPLKRLGRKDIIHSTSIGNVQKNFLEADYLLFPNTYTRDIMMEDYMISRIYEGSTVVIDYPRNDALFNEKRSEEIRKKYDLGDKKVLAYMPTWRGVGRSANIEQQIDNTIAILDYLDLQLEANDILYVNLHFLVDQKISYKKYRHIRQFPVEYETYAFLAVCDVLISDYSSVMIDFAQTGRDVIMYTYDFEEYNREKGFYFDIKTLPFKMVFTSDELGKAIHSGQQNYNLEKQFIGEHFGHATLKMLNLMCYGKEDDISIEKWYPDDDVRVVHVGNLLKTEDKYITDRFIAGLRDEEKEKLIVTFENPLTGQCLSYLNNLDQKVHFVRFVLSNFKPFREKTYVAQEEKRLMYGINPAQIEFLQSGHLHIANMIAHSNSRKIYHNIPGCLKSGLNRQFAEKPKLFVDFLSHFDEVINYPFDFCNELWQEEGIMSMGTVAEFKPNRFTADNEKITIEGIVDISNIGCDYKINQKVIISDIEYHSEINIISETSENSIFRKRARMKIIIESAQVLSWNASNTVGIGIIIHDTSFYAKIRNTGSLVTIKKTFRIANLNNVCLFKTSKAFFKIIVRDENVTDRCFEKIKLGLAFALSRITLWYKPVILYEKECARYEESAAVLLEYLADINYKNAKFILDRNNIYFDEIPQKCRKYIINKYSFSHYYSLFAAKTLISSETVTHALEKHATSRLFDKYIVRGSKNYIFLQHGVMYMVSLGSEKRKFFSVNIEKGNKRVVVSSQLEADHFKRYTRYRDENIYITGLLKFDKNIMYSDADKITVMLTWRPWEYVSGINDILETNYYRMIKKIEEAIPDELKDKLTILPHPLIAKQMKDIKDSSIALYILHDEKYDQVLRSTKLLVTDYSSISYDAFYRGANVIFDWEEKDACMKEYGHNGSLMLTESLAFGDICMNSHELTEAIKENYTTPQKEEYVRRYRQIVEFHDGKNTERFVNMAMKDGLI